MATLETLRPKKLRQLIKNQTARPPNESQGIIARWRNVTIPGLNDIQAFILEDRNNGVTGIRITEGACTIEITDTHVAGYSQEGNLNPNELWSFRKSPITHELEFLLQSGSGNNPKRSIRELTKEDKGAMIDSGFHPALLSLMNEFGRQTKSEKRATLEGGIMAGSMVMLSSMITYYIKAWSELPSQDLALTGWILAASILTTLGSAQWTAMEFSGEMEMFLKEMEVAAQLRMPRAMTEAVLRTAISPYKKLARWINGKNALITNRNTSSILKR